VEPNPYQSPSDPRPNDPASSPPALGSSLFPSFGASFGAYAVALVGFSATTCGCHFQLAAVPFTIIPVAWTALMLASYRTSVELALAVISLAATMFWLFITWQGNLRFLF
jgi:hypothetical protein